MSGLLKAFAVDGSAVRGIHTVDHADSEERARLHQRIALLEEEVERRDAHLVAAARAHEKGVAEGYAQGLKDADDGAAARLDKLDAAIKTASAKLHGALAGTERLAALLARECLTKLFADVDDRAHLVCELIERQVQMLESAAIITIEVSARDFPDEDARALVAQAAGSSDIQVSALPTLPSGACSIALRLGRIEVGFDQQWGALDALLGELAEPDPLP